MRRRCRLCRASHSFSILVTTKNAIISTDAANPDLLHLASCFQGNGQFLFRFFCQTLFFSPLFFFFFLNAASRRYSCYRVSSRPATGITRKWTPSRTSNGETRTLGLTGRHVKAKKKRPIDSCVKFGAKKKKGGGGKDTKC